MADKVLTAGEEEVMKMASHAMMLRCADVIDRLTEADVADAQIALMRSGVPLSLVHRVDRCMLGAAHLRACAESLDEKSASIKTRDLLKMALVK